MWDPGGFGLRCFTTSYYSWFSLKVYSWISYVGIISMVAWKAFHGPLPVLQFLQLTSGGKLLLFLLKYCARGNWICMRWNIIFLKEITCNSEEYEQHLKAIIKCGLCSIWGHMCIICLYLSLLFKILIIYKVSLSTMVGRKFFFFQKVFLLLTLILKYVK